MDYLERLRRLTINDTRSANAGFHAVESDELDPKSVALVRLAALVAVGGSVPSYGEHVDGAVSAGATAAEVVAVLVDIAAVVGIPAVVAAAPKVAMALGYDVDAVLDGPFGD